MARPRNKTIDDLAKEPATGSTRGLVAANIEKIEAARALGHSWRAIAQVLGVSESAANHAYHRVKRKKAKPAPRSMLPTPSRQPRAEPAKTPGGFIDAGVD